MVSDAGMAAGRVAGNDTDVSADGVSLSNTYNGIYANMKVVYDLQRAAYEAAGGNWFDEVCWEVSAAPDNGASDDGGSLAFARAACEAIDRGHEVILAGRGEVDVLAGEAGASLCG